MTLPQIAQFQYDSSLQFEYYTLNGQKHNRQADMNA